jgi:hypothetical protein
MDKASEAASEAASSPSVGHATAHYHSTFPYQSNIEYSLDDNASVIPHYDGIEAVPTDSSTNFEDDLPPAYHQLTIANGGISAEVMRTQFTLTLEQC